MAVDMRNNEAGRFLTLLGQTSAGKTMLARLLSRFWLRLPRRTYRDGREPPSHYARIDWPRHDWRQISEDRDAEMMFIDEIGRGERGAKGADWSRLMDLLNYRQERRLWTVITANLTFREIQAVDPAIASRLRRNEGIVLQAGSGVRPYEDRAPNAPHELPPTQEREPRSGTEGAIGG